MFSTAALLTPLQVTRNFGNEVWRLSTIEITFSLGMMAGGILVGMWGGFKNRVYTMTLAAALGPIPNFWQYLVIMALMGLSMPLGDIISLNAIPGNRFARGAPGHSHDDKQNPEGSGDKVGDLSCGNSGKALFCIFMEDSDEKT